MTRCFRNRRAFDLGISVGHNVAIHLRDATKAGSPEAVPLYARQFYIEQLRRDPEALRASFECYRALDISIPQHQKLRDAPKLPIPCLGFGGAMAVGDGVAHELKQLVERFDFVKIEACGHYPAEEK